MRKVHSIPHTKSPVQLLTLLPVLSFLEGMAREGDEPDNSPPRSMADPDEYRSKAESIRNGTRSPQIYSPAPRSKASETLLNPGGMFSPRNGVKSNKLIEEVHGDDADSNVQDGVRSEIGEMVAVRLISNICFSFSDHVTARARTQRSSWPKVRVVRLGPFVRQLWTTTF